MSISQTELHTYFRVEVCLYVHAYICIKNEILKVGKVFLGIIFIRLVFIRGDVTKGEILGK